MSNRRGKWAVKALALAVFALPATAQDFYTYQQSAPVEAQMTFFLPESAVILDAEIRRGRVTLHTAIPLTRIRWVDRKVCVTFGSWKKIPEKAEFIGRDGRVYLWAC